MKILPKIALALSAFAVVGASAQTVHSGQADQDRRDRNREEALAKHRTGGATAAEDRSTVREKGHRAAQATRGVAHKTADAVRRAGHATAEKAREITDRTNAKFGEPKTTK
ncbi:MAG: hypothetical protein ACXWUL_03635 [Caldimonas sp.]